MDFRIGDRVMGTKKGLSHRVGKLGTIVGKRGGPLVLWDGEAVEHFTLKDEIMLVLDLLSVQKEDKPKIWRDMTPEEKGALLLAQHEGKDIEVFGLADPDMWHDRLHPCFEDDCAYRIKPEPKRETLKLYGKNGWYDPAIGTIDLIDGKPDPSSIKIWGV